MSQPPSEYFSNALQEFSDTPITDAAELAALEKRYRRPRPRRIRTWWLGGAGAVAAALLLGFVAGHFFLRDSAHRDGREVLLASLSPQPAPPRAGQPEQKLSLDRRGIYQLKEGDFQLKFQSPRAGYATFVLLAPGQAKVYPASGQDQIQVEALQPRDYGPLSLPADKTTVILFVTEKPADADLSKIQPEQDADRFLSEAKERLWQTGHRWLAYDRFVIEPAK